MKSCPILCRKLLLAEKMNCPGYCLCLLSLGQGTDTPSTYGSPTFPSPPLHATPRQAVDAGALFDSFGPACGHESKHCKDVTQGSQTLKGHIGSTLKVKYTHTLVRVEPCLSDFHLFPKWV
ncbi:hypothetical protein PoB_001131700 [Plakobranchus ocellatus]|uniref:Uncharacterized protein n=1 Tax=Plakobranchus ocellatus TaxID=259542 RepID=A0AAV3YPB8_9GAST|nr:hypothetical protein PoB_001131700 [Plakobranchus ocellatus]